MSTSPKTIRWPSLVTIISVAILVGTELLGAAWAAGWAVASLLQLGNTVGTVLQGVFALIALLVVAVFMRQAVKAEPVVGD